MIKIGLTGGIGTGKTFVAGVFSALGIPVFFADQEAKKAYLDIDVLERIKVLFGEIVFDNNGINFIKISNLIFSNKIALEKLNEIIHPFVLNKFEKWLQENNTALYIIMESAILFETGFDSIFDKNIAVTAPKEVCIERVMKRDGIERDMVLKRMSNQFSNETIVTRSDFTIQNTDDGLLLLQVLKIHNTLLKQ
jgi:dephospho-CoA kinase